jgi:CHASE2 domain-containing sensor protein/predicted Ser/Thr protein kinase
MSDEGRALFDESVIAARRLRRFALVAAAVLVVLRLGAELTPLMRRPDLVLLDAWQSLRGTRSPSPQVVIVAVDEKSIARFGPPAWPRSEYVPLIERLSRSGARVIGFDFTFGALGRDAEASARFAEAMKQAGNVVFGYEFTRVGDGTPPPPPSDALRANALARFDSVALPPAASVIEPEPVLAAAAAAIGHVRAVESEDGRIRVVPLLIEHAGKAYPSLGLQVARIYTGTPLDQVQVSDGRLRMGDWEIPVSASGEVMLDWPAGGESAFARYSFLDVVRGDVPEEAFRDKAVLVAGTADGLDDRDFPFALEAPGVLMYATFLDNVFRVDFVQAPLWAWVVEWGLFLALCGLGVWLLPRLSSRLLLVGIPLLLLLVLAAAAFLFVQKGVWLKVFYPGLALLAPMGLMVALRLTASEKERIDVTAQKVESQKLLGLSFQEKGMLDLALATFAKLPLTEDMKLVYVNLGLDYENRGQRDKAQLEYKMVSSVDPRYGDVAQRLERLGQSGAGASVPTLGIPVAATAAPLAPTVPEAQMFGAVEQTLSGQAETWHQSFVSGAPPAPPGSQTPASLAALPGSMPATSIGPPTVATGALPSLDAPTSHYPAGAPTPGAGTPRPASATPAPPSMMPGSIGPQAAGGGPVLPGTRFGRYEVLRHLGRGGMGQVYLVRDTVINRQAALKTIRLDTGGDDPQHVIEIRQRFYREGQTAGRLTHPNIVTVYDLGEALGMSYIVMEYVEGKTLTKLMKKQRLSVAQIKHVLYHAAIALDHAHEHGIFHRDVKPDNVMVTRSGLVKVMDFGIARLTESELTKTGSVMGTPAYMSPEQVHGQKVDGRTDIFSLGVILYELLTGKTPFSGETVPSLMMAILKGDWAHPSALDANVSKAWDPILAKALANDREQRYATAAEFAQAVKDAPVN